MCGRCVSTRRPQDLAQSFHVGEWPTTEVLAPNWNVAPTADVWAVLERTPRGDGGAAAPSRELRPLRWGRVPSWAKEPKIGARMINARVETVHEKPAFRRAFVKRRCLLPADGFYEWQPGEDPATGKAWKQPYFIHPEDDQVMALAGLYEYWRDPAVPPGRRPGRLADDLHDHHLRGHRGHRRRQPRPLAHAPLALIPSSAAHGAAVTS